MSPILAEYRTTVCTKRKRDCGLPILDGRGAGVTPPVLRDIVSRQTSGKRRIVMVELSLLSVAQAQAVIEVARADHVRVMSNTLSGVVGVVDRGTDVNALRSPDQVWGWLIDAGVTAFQTDEPAVLLEFLGRRGAHRSSP
jgi:glycerophosphoryl diester phosphodiesterase